MKIKLDKPIEFTSSVGNRNMSIGNKDINDSSQQSKNSYLKVSDTTSKTTTVAENDTSHKVDRVETSKKVEKTNTDYSNMVHQRSEKLNQYRKDLISQTTTENNAKSNVKREENKKELIQKMSTSNDNIKRVQQEFNDNKELVTSKIQEQNDSNVQAQAKLRESKRQLLAEIQKTNESNNQVKQDLQQNKRELASTSTKQTNLQKTGESSTESKETKEKQTSIEERKVELVRKVMENTNEDATIKQKLSQYKRELADASAKKEQLDNQAKINENNLQKLETNDNVEGGTDSELEKIREIINENEMEKNFNELIVSNLDAKNDANSDLETAEANLKASKLKVETKSKASKKSKNIKPSNTNISSNATPTPNKSTSTPKKSKIIDISSKVAQTTDSYKSPNLTTFDVTLSSDISTISTFSMSNTASNISDISDSVATATSSNNNDDIDKQAIKNKIAIDSDATTEIQQKLRNYQSEVIKINSEILKLSSDSGSTSFASYKNATEADLIESVSGIDDLFEDELLPEEVELAQMESIFDFENDIQEVEIMMSAQDEMSNVIKLIATEIKQDELLAKIAEQEQIIARNKILEKRESLVELAKQNTELLRSLNERLAIITKKVTRNVVYSPTIISQRNRMIA